MLFLDDGSSPRLMPCRSPGGLRRRSTSQPHHGSDLSFGYLALAVLNGVLRPILSRWHGELLAHEQQRPATESVVSWERAWPHADTLRQQLDAARDVLLDYADVLALVADVPPLHVR